MKITAGALIIAGLIAAGAVYAQSSETLGDKLASGALSENAVHQLLVNTGLTLQEASGMTVNEVVATRWQND